MAVIPAGPTPLAKKLESQVRLALETANVRLSAVSGLREQEAIQCETNRLCFALLGRVVGAFAIVRVESAVLGSDVAVLVEAVESASGRLIREESFVIPTSSVDNEMRLRLAPLVAKLVAALPPAKPVVLAEVRPEPAVANPALDLAAAPAKSSSFPIWVTGTGAVVFAGASAGLLAVGASARNCLHGPPAEGSPTICVPQSQVAGVQQRADLGLVTGTAAAAIAVGLTLTAIVQHLISN